MRQDIAMAVFLVLSVAGCSGQTKRPPSKPDYSAQVAKCKEQIRAFNTSTEKENNDKIELAHAAESRILTPKETKRLLDLDYQVYITYSELYCDEQGNEGSSTSESYNKEELHKKFLDLLYQQARFRSIEDKKGTP